MNPRVPLGILAVALPLLLSTTEPTGARKLSFEDRVNAQRAIEEVYWRHRTWPEANKNEKPRLSAVMPAEAIRSRVEDYLKKSNALAEGWGRPISAAQIQAEMERMARETKAPQVLAELFAALDNDPALIAETLVRQKLVERQLRDAYVYDVRMHGAIRVRAEHAMEGATSLAELRSRGGEYSETTWRLRKADSIAEESELTKDAPDPRPVVALDIDAWQKLAAELKRKLDPGGTGEPAPWSPLEETADGFVVTSILSSGPDELVTATVTWPKKSFDAWWRVERAGYTATVDENVGAYRMVSPSEGQTCVADTWRPFDGEIPNPRYAHSAVWTGSEMIVWAGGEISGGRYDPATDSWVATAVDAGTPSGRSLHTTVWTGTEMIVWGGWSGGYVNTGGRYNPSTDTWTALPTGAGVPAGRQNHTAVWTGTEMIVWGGDNATPFLMDTGGRYDPATNAWTSTSTGAGVPTGRKGHSAVWTGAQMIVWGGQDFTGRVNSGGRYDPSTNTWTATSTSAGVPSRRDEHTAVWTGTEMIVWGGNAGISDLNTGGRYDPSTNTWNATSTTSGVPGARRAHLALWTGSNMIVWGGWESQFYEFLSNSGGRYDPATDTWAPTSKAAGVPSPRTSSSAVWTGHEMIVWGGYDGAATNSGSRYDPSTDTWVAMSTGAGVPSPRYKHVGVWTGAEMIVWGGRRATYENTGGRYDPATDTWTPTSTAPGVPAGRMDAGAVWTGTRMVVWGGEGFGWLDSGGRYDPTTDTWAPTSIGSDTPPGRSRHVAVWTGSKMIVWGGSTGFLGMNTGGQYDPETDTWVPTSMAPGVPLPAVGRAGVWTGTEMIVWGGWVNGVGYINSGGRYNPVSNSWSATSTSPGVLTRRAYVSAVWTGSEMILWGGFDGFLTYATGSRYSPSTDTWTATSTGAGVPSARTAHTAVWTGSDMILWGGGVPSNTGGRYDPSTDSWIPTSIGANVPSARDSHTAVWTGTEMIVWGGSPLSSSSGAYCGCPDGRLVYRDGDGDGYGNPASSLASCDGAVPPGYAAQGTDCNDNDAAMHPGATELCNGVDDDCDGASDDGAGALCEDGNACTDDACTGAEGCVHAPNADPCDDGDACTSGDTCGGGLCHPGGPMDCDDGNCCTADSCDPASGCTHVPNTAAPVFTVEPSLGETTLWPPSHAYADFTVADTRAATSSDCGIASIHFASCTSSQPENGTGMGDGNTTRDCVYEPGALHVRAERDGACSPIGRVYAATLVAVDACGNTTESDPFFVGVFHHRGQAPAGGTIVHAGGDPSEVRSGTNGTYGMDCGLGSGTVNGTDGDHSDFDPEMEIAQQAALDVDDLRLSKASDGNLELTWGTPVQIGRVTRFYIWRLDPGTQDWTKIAEVPKQANVYRDAIPSDGGNWQYKVTAVIK